MNPFFSAEIPTLLTLFNGHVPTLAYPTQATPTSDADKGNRVSVVLSLDPLMDLDGLPQSGTGQTALLTGRNAARLYGRHFGPWVPVPLRTLMMEENVLSRAQNGGASCAFANAYPSQYHYLAWSKRPAGPALAAKGAGLLTRHEDHLAGGTALSSEILNSAWRTRLGFHQIPEITAEDAGRNLARITKEVDLTFFAHYATDTAGHERRMDPAVAALERVDRFFLGLLNELASETLVVVASDHGNIEDVTIGHTYNPVLGIVAGPNAEELARGTSSITHVPDLILGALDQA
ncbi:MAG: alkaline phosphatase family protein [Gemmatimonadota bacterium]